MIITTARVLLVSVPVAYCAVFLLDGPLESIWMGMLMGGTVSTIISFFWVRHLVWKRDPTERAQAERKEAEKAAAGRTSTDPAKSATISA